MRMTGDAYLDYGRGETPRLAGRAVYRQARKRFKCPTPPKGCLVTQTNLDKYNKWYQKVLDLYDSVPKDEITKNELRADERWFNGITNLENAIRALRKRNKEKRLRLADVDPYRDLTYAVGSEDDFVCFGFGVAQGWFVFQSVVNSETGSFIQEFDYYDLVNQYDAVDTAIYMVDEALEWCFENGVIVDHEGWGYSAAKFIEDVKAAVEDDETPNPFEIGVFMGEDV